MPTPEDLKRLGLAYAAHGIRAHFDVGNITAYHNLGIVHHPTWDDHYESTDADAYLVPTSAPDGSVLARGGEVIQEGEVINGVVKGCDPTSPACRFPDYPGTIPWKLGLQFERDAPVGVNGEQLTGTALTDWLNLPPSQQRQRFDPERRSLFHYVLFAHARGKPKSPFPCLDANGQPTGYPEGSTTCADAAHVNKDHHAVMSSSQTAAASR